MDHLRALETWMRERGVRRAKWGDIELELGELPSSHVQMSPLETSPEEAEKMARRELKEALNIRYAHVGGWTGSDAELDRMLGVSR